MTPIEKRQLYEAVRDMTPVAMQKFLRDAPEDVRHLLRWDWDMKAREEQMLPDGDWTYWLILAGRGFGKTRTGAETVRKWVKGNRYINLIGATADDAKDIMIEGESGILACCPTDERPYYKKHERKLEWPNGATSLIFTADEPERLRGKQHEKLWSFPHETLVLTRNGDRCIGDITIGDEVLTRAGYKPVVDTANYIGVTGAIALDDGTELVGTGDHRVMTDRGWVQMQHLTEDDLVWKSTGLSNRTATSGRISGRATKPTNERLCINIGGCGSGIAGLSQRVATFTTSTGTKLTTALRTWSVLVTPSILAYIWSCGQSTLNSITRATYLASNAGSLLPVSALIGMPDATGVTSGVETVSGKRTRSSAAFAGEPITAFGDLRVIAAGVVRTWVAQEKQRVYCLTVADQPEFFANTILAHNCDEMAAWRYPAAWDQAKFGLRLGAKPQAIITTTPRPTRMMRELIGDKKCHVTKGSTYDNRENLAENFFDDIIGKYEGTRLGRQELMAEMLNDMPGALWSQSLIDKNRIPEDAAPPMRRIVVAVDPATSNEEHSDETGIVVAGVDETGKGYVLADYSGKYSPEEWARQTVAAYNRWSADRIIAEKNQGGDMVAFTLKSIMATAPITLVSASRGKTTRAEPVSALYEQGRVIHVGAFEELEDQMCAFTIDLDRRAFGKSPDRVDALVWAFTELFPRIIKTTNRRTVTYKPKQRFFM